MSDSIFSLRTAHTSDCPSLRLMEVAAQEELSSFRGAKELIETIPLIGKQWEEVMQDTLHTVIVVEFESVLGGYAVMTQRNDVAMIEQIYIDPLGRQLGAGASLIAMLRASATQAGCTRLESYALPGDRQMKNLFERAAMKTRLLTVSTAL